MSVHNDYYHHSGFLKYALSELSWDTLQPEQLSEGIAELIQGLFRYDGIRSYYRGNSSNPRVLGAYLAVHNRLYPGGRFEAFQIDPLTQSIERIELTQRQPLDAYLVLRITENVQEDHIEFDIHNTGNGVPFDRSVLIRLRAMGAHLMRAGLSAHPTRLKLVMTRNAFFDVAFIVFVSAKDPVLDQIGDLLRDIIFSRTLAAVSRSDMIEVLEGNRRAIFSETNLQELTADWDQAIAESARKITAALLESTGRHANTEAVTRRVRANEFAFLGLRGAIGGGRIHELVSLPLRRLMQLQQAAFDWLLEQNVHTDSPWVQKFELLFRSILDRSERDKSVRVMQVENAIKSRFGGTGPFLEQTAELSSLSNINGASIWEFFRRGYSELVAIGTTEADNLFASRIPFSATIDPGPFLRTFVAERYRRFRDGMQNVAARSGQPGSEWSEEAIRLSLGVSGIQELDPLHEHPRYSDLVREAATVQQATSDLLVRDNPSFLTWLLRGDFLIGSYLLLEELLAETVSMMLHRLSREDATKMQQEFQIVASIRKDNADYLPALCRQSLSTLLRIARLAPDRPDDLTAPLKNLLTMEGQISNVWTRIKMDSSFQFVSLEEACTHFRTLLTLILELMRANVSAAADHKR